LTEDPKDGVNRRNLAVSRNYLLYFIATSPSTKYTTNSITVSATGSSGQLYFVEFRNKCTRNNGNFE